MDAAGYREARRKFFEELRDSHDRSIEYWKRIWRKSNSVEEMHEIYERMCDHGAASQYCQDAVKALKMMEEAEDEQTDSDDI